MGVAKGWRFKFYWNKPQEYVTYVELGMMFIAEVVKQAMMYCQTKEHLTKIDVYNGTKLRFTVYR